MIPNLGQKSTNDPCLGPQVLQVDHRNFEFRDAGFITRFISRRDLSQQKLFSGMSCSDTIHSTLWKFLNGIPT